MSRTSEIKTLIMGLIENGYTVKSEIYDKILESNPDFKRPEIRRAAGQLRQDLLKILKVLNKDTLPEV